MPRLLLAAAAALLLLAVAFPSPASAVGPGAPGKVAVTSPGKPVRIWDPVQAVEEAGQPDAGFTTIAAKGAPAIGDGTFAPPSRPQWSPDGTKLVFTQSTEDPGDVDPEQGPMQQTSLYLYTVATGAVEQLTTPEPRLIDDDEDDLSEGHIVNDFAPTFTDDGQHVAFLRDVDAYEDDELASHQGTQLWTVPVSGGDPSRRSSFDPDEAPKFMGLVSIPGTDSFLASGVDDDYVVMRLELGSSSMQEIPGTRGVMHVPATIDVSPDGTRFSRSEIVDDTFGAVVRKLNGAVLASQKGTDGVAFSPSGNGAIGRGCVRDVCGMVETFGFADDTPRDTGGDKQRIVLKFPYDNSDGLVAVQPQQLPIVFLPGFLGSEIECGGAMQWPAVPADTLGMRLASDGKTNAGCPGTAPTGKAIGSFLSSDVYEGISDALKARFGDRAVVMGWDWRKRAEEAWEQLDDTIAELTSTDLAQQQDARRVVLWGHSYGGLLARSYLVEHPEKVAQILSVGSPFLGSPKVVFPLAFGVETPMASAMDLLFDNDDMKTFSRNLAGLYELMPSPQFPRSWFSIDGETSTTAQMVDRLHGNKSLLAQAQADHAELFDGFETDDARVDVRALVGTGIGTIDRIDLRPYDDEEDDITIHLGNGDKTVPGMSANQGELGTTDPLGDDVRVQYQCDVDHVALANDPQVIAAYVDWADRNAVPLEVKKRPCEVDGQLFEYTPGEIDSEPASDERSAARGVVTPTLAEAEQDELLDVVRLPRRTFVATDRRRTGPFSVELRNATFRVTPVGAAGEGKPVEYGPVTGTATITPAAKPGELPTITVGGVPVAPRDVPVKDPDTSGGQNGGSGDQSGTPGGGTTSGGSATPASRPSVPAAGGRPASKPALRIVGRPRLRGRTLTLRVALPAKGKLRTRVTARGRTLGQRTTKAAAGRTVQVSVRLRSRPRSPVRVSLVFTPARGKASRLSATVARR